MSDDRHNPFAGGMDDVLPIDLRPLDARLSTDSALWGARLPAADRLAEQARELPERMPVTHHATTSIRPAPTRLTDTYTRGQMQMTATRLRASLTVAAAVAVVALLAVLFNALASSHSTVGSGGPGGTTTTWNNTSTTTPSAGQTPTPGPILPPYMQPPVTVQGVDAQGNPVHPTTQFAVNSTVYVVIPIRGLPAGQHHILTVHWLLNGKDIQLPNSANVTQTVTHDGNVSFSLTYPTAGVGEATIVLDSTQLTKIPFTIGPADGVPTSTARPTSAATPTSAPTPAPTPTLWPNPPTATPGA